MGLGAGIGIGQRRAFSIYLALCWMAGVGIQAAAVGQATRPGRLPRELESRLAPGIRVALEQRSERGIAEDVRSQRLFALHVPRGQRPSPWLGPSPINVTFEGYVRMRLPDVCQFRVHGLGTVKLDVQGRSVLKGTVAPPEPLLSEWIPLVRGHNLVKLSYASSEDTEATVRLEWKSADFDWEPIPPPMLWHDASETTLVESSASRLGRHLVLSHGCFQCHATVGEKVNLETSASIAPSLVNAGDRFNRDWLVEWILDPRRHRPDATMPNLFRGLPPEVAARDAADIAEYVMRTHEPRSEPEPSDIATQQTVDDVDGAVLFETLGCIACHMLDANSEHSASRISLSHVNTKYRRESLSDFLMDPQEHWAARRMPNFKLSIGEARALATFLTEEMPSTPRMTPPSGDVGRGRELYFGQGCANCHGSMENRSLDRVIATAWDRLDATQGCLAEHANAAPWFPWTTDERNAIRAVLSRKDVAHIREPIPIEDAQYWIDRLSCVACHPRDGQPARLPQLLTEEGTHGFVAESLPSLTWTGEKLHRPWLESFVAGKSTDRPRPWLKTRMPAFPGHASLIAQGLARQHGVSAEVAETGPPAADGDLKLAGSLIEKDGGLNCIQCHGVGSRPAAAPFESPGINFALTRQRLRYPYYHRWMWDPPRIDPSTKMPKLADPVVRANFPSAPSGDLRRQFDAIWNYIQTVGEKNASIDSQSATPAVR